MTKQNTLKIQTLNDSFRITGKGGKIIMSNGILDNHTDEQIEDIGVFVRQYQDYTPDSDPLGEHDFGSFQYDGEKLFWKIDCYSRDMKHPSENPACYIQTQRVLTIMLAEEY